MDSSLVHLSDVFQSREAREQRSSYKLFVFLLATSMDRTFLLEYLRRYNELHHLTGRRILVIGPAFDPNIRVAPQYRIQIHQLDAFAERIGLDPEINDDDLGNASLFLRFLAVQTRESYSLARLLNLSLDSLPLMVFMEELDDAKENVVWPLAGKSFHEFSQTLRRLVQELETRCGWGAEDRLALLRQQWHKDLRREGAESQIRFRETLARVRLEFDAMIASPPKPIPSTEVGRTLAQLEGGANPNGLVEHLISHGKRWSSRLPQQYKQAIDELQTRASGVRDWNPSEPLEELRASVALSGFEAEKRALQTQLTKAERPLLVVEDVLRARVRKNIPLDRETIERTLSRRDWVPRVFISYSHDSIEHKKVVVDLAQRLRERNIDAWLDQFEVGPEPGFPRWMATQIDEADKVLLVCTKVYRARFESQAKESRGVTFEAHLVYQDLYDVGVRSRKFIPVLPDASGTRDDVPRVLRGFPSFTLPSDFEALCRSILEEPSVRAAPLGGR